MSALIVLRDAVLDGKADSLELIAAVEVELDTIAVGGWRLHTRRPVNYAGILREALRTDLDFPRVPVQCHNPEATEVEAAFRALAVCQKPEELVQFWKAQRRYFDRKHRAFQLLQQRFRTGTISYIGNIVDEQIGPPPPCPRLSYNVPLTLGWRLAPAFPAFEVDPEPLPDSSGIGGAIYWEYNRFEKATAGQITADVARTPHVAELLARARTALPPSSDRSSTLTAHRARAHALLRDILDQLDAELD